MRKYWKKALVLAGVMAVLGAALCVTALAKVDFDFWRLSTDYEPDLNVETVQYDPAEVSEIVLNISVDDLRIEPSEDGQIHFQYAQRQTRPYTCSLYGGVLRVTQEQEGWRWFRFDFGWRSPESTAVLSLPQPFQGDLTLHDDVGEVRADTLRLTGHLNCRLNTGALRLYGVEAASILAQLDTGSLRGEDWQCPGDLDVESDTGEIYGIGWQAGGDLSVESDTGAIRLEDCTAEGDFSCSSSTGEIRLTRVRARSADVESNVGDVTLEALSAPHIQIESDTGAILGTIDGSEQDYTIEADADIGDCNLHDRAGLTDKTLTVESDIGEIRLTFTQP